MRISIKPAPGMEQEVIAIKGRLHHNSQSIASTQGKLADLERERAVLQQQLGNLVYIITDDDEL